MSLKAHYIFGTTSAFSHLPPVINLSVSLLTHTPDLTVSVILHVNNVDKADKLIGLSSDDVKGRLKLFPVGQKAEWRDTPKTYMDMVTGSGEVYGAILADKSRPFPAVFVYDITSFFYVHVKPAVEAHMPGIKSPKPIAYNPEATCEMLLLAGSVENGSLRWKEEVFTAHNPESAGLTLEQMASPDFMADKEKHKRIAKTYRECMAESDKIVNIAGYPPFHLYERWSYGADWDKTYETAWFQYLHGLQGGALKADGWITCFPSSVWEPEALHAAKHDSVLGGNDGYTELGYFEVRPAADWGIGLKEFLDSQKEKSVIYVSFGTVVEAGFGLDVLLEYLAESRATFLFAGGNQKDALPAKSQALLAKAEAEGYALVPNWVDQIGVLSHPSVMCFLSHCGVNSTFESILACVPIITWAVHQDQIQLSSMVYARQIGVELLQHRAGYAVGRGVAHRPDIVQGTPEALREELDAAFATVKRNGQEMRERCGAIGGEIRRKRTGEWDEAVKAFGKAYR